MMNLKQSLNESVKHMQNGDVHLAEINFKKILKEHPDNPDALSLLGILYIHQKKFKKGKDLIKSSLLVIPNQPQAIFNLGLAFHQENQFDEAIKYFEQAIQYQPKYADAYYFRALSFKNKGMFESAIENFINSININPEHYDSIFNLGSLYLDLKKYNEAARTLERAMRIDPGNIEVLNMIGISLNGLRDFERAIIIFNNSLKIKYPQDDAMMGLGFAYLQTRKFDLSLKIYTEMLNFNPKNIYALNNRANAFHFLDDCSAAINDLDQLIAIKQDFPEAFATYGNVLTKLKKFDEAKEKFELAFKYKENYSGAYQNRGMMFFYQKKYDNAIADFSSAIILDPNFLEAYNGRGASFRAMRNFDSALKDFKKIVELNPDDADSYPNLIELYSVMDMSEESENIYKKAIAIDNKNINANYNFSFILLSKKQFDKGWLLYEYRYFADQIRYDFSSRITELKNKFNIYQGQLNKGTLIIISEQGIGDQVLFLSLMHEVQKVNKKIIVFANSKLINLFQRSFGNVNFILNDSLVTNQEWFDELDKHSFDFFVFTGSLGKFFRNSLDDFIRQPLRFLKSDPLEVKSLMNLLGKKDKKLCGLSWKSSSELTGIDKSISLKSLIDILKIPELDFVNLQYGDVEEEIKFISSEIGVNIDLVSDIDKYNNIDSLTSLIDVCVYVVTTSNVTAHIAGGLGKDTYLLVPFLAGRIWYWHDQDDKSIWYPSVKIFRQNKDGSWVDAITSIAKQLKGS